jgi:hypothetical protein
MQNKMKGYIFLITFILLLVPIFFISTASASDNMTPTSTGTTPGDPEVDAAVAAALSILTIIVALKVAESQLIASGETPEKAKQHVNVLAEGLRPLINTLLKKIPENPSPPAIKNQPVPPIPSPKAKLQTCNYCSGQGFINCPKCGGTGRLVTGSKDGHPTYSTCECFFRPQPGPGRVTCTICNGKGKIIIPSAPTPVTK